MILVKADKINKSYTETPLLQDISLSIHEGEKIGLIGANGTGKSTLLKIVAGIEEPDSGRVVYTNDVKRAFLPQHPEYDGDLTVAEQAAEYMAEVDPKTPDFACRSMMTKLGVRDFNAKMKELSGGQRKRVAMAAVLSAGADFLILDEPTNHMDNDVIAYLEDFLVKYKGAVLMITHDRYFLDRVTKKIFEIDGGSLYSYDGNYDYYLETKAAREEMLLASERKRAALYKKELAWIRRGARARSTKAKSHIERFEELRDSKLIIDDSSLSIGTVSSRLGKKIIEIENLSKAYGEKQLIRDFTYTVLRNDRIGIIGDNGSGKSTFLKMILGEVEPDQGIITIGQTVKIGYFSQDTQVWDPNQRVIKYVEGISDNVRTEDGYLSASQMLERFLFPSIKHSLPIGRLSGGADQRSGYRHADCSRRLSRRIQRRGPHRLSRPLLPGPSLHPHLFLRRRRRRPPLPRRLYGCYESKGTGTADSRDEFLRKIRRRYRLRRKIIPPGPRKKAEIHFQRKERIRNNRRRYRRPGRKNRPAE